MQRRLGVNADLACRRPPRHTTPQPKRFITDKARQLGIEPLTGFHLNRTRRLVGTLIDVKRLTKYLTQESIDVVHAHRPQDHLIGGLSARLSGGRIMVRTNHTSAPLQPTLLHRHSFRRLTDAYIGFSRYAADRDAATFGLPRRQVFVIDASIDLERFDADVQRRDVRTELGFGHEHVVGGIVARLQPHRRFDVLFDAIRRARCVVPTLRFVVIGSGTDFDRVAREPLVRLGLTDAVVLAGHRDGDYVDYLAGLDFNVLLVPGSDGTCRAVREAMAMGKPVITSRRGILPDLVTHTENGLTVDDTPTELAEAIICLASDADRRRRMGAAARAHAKEQFRPEVEARSVLDVYEQMRVRSSGKGRE